MARYKIDCCQPDCPSRSGECHSTCGEYKTQRKEYEETKAEQMKKGEVRRGLEAQKSKTIYNIRKRCKMKGL